MRILSVALLAGLFAAATLMPIGNAAHAACSDVWKPVCGKQDGFKHTYTNACWAKMAKAHKVHPGACKW